MNVADLTAIDVHVHMEHTSEASAADPERECGAIVWAPGSQIALYPIGHTRLAGFENYKYVWRGSERWLLPRNLDLHQVAGGVPGVLDGAASAEHSLREAVQGVIS